MGSLWWPLMHSGINAGLDSLSGRLAEQSYRSPVRPVASLFQVEAG